MEFSVMSLLTGALILSDQDPSLMTSFNLITSIKARSPNTAPLGLGPQHMDLGRHSS